MTGAMTGAEREALAQALLSGFPTPDDLAQLVRFGLDERLDAIAAPGVLPARILAVIEWAEASGRTAELTREAIARRPGNPKLRALEAPAAAPRARRRILFLATDHRSDEAKSIHGELEQSTHRDRLELETRWAAEPLDLLRELNKVRPSILHLCGAPPRWASAAAIAQTVEAAGPLVEAVVLSSCYDDARAEALLAHVAYVVGMEAGADPAATRAFAMGFYGALGEQLSIDTAFAQGHAAIALAAAGAGGPAPRLRTRDQRR